jgi:type IV pilus assembly protein PilX
MLNRQLPAVIGGQMKHRQQGVVLMIALIMLVALTLAGIALVRSVDTTNIIAGNLAFKQSAANAGDIGVESAIAWLELNKTGAGLHQDVLVSGYAASWQPAIGATQTWDQYWTLLDGNNQIVTVTPSPLTGYTVKFAIQRLCNTSGDPVTVALDCATSQTTSNSAGSSRGAGVIQLLFASAVYYRITTRVEGPRNTVSYIQTIVSL